jgi:hypothetical protein
MKKSLLLSSLAVLAAIAVTSANADAKTRTDVAVVYVSEPIQVVTTKDKWGSDGGAIFTKVFAWPYPLYMCVWPVCGPSSRSR